MAALFSIPWEYIKHRAEYIFLVAFGKFQVFSSMRSINRCYEYRNFLVHFVKFIKPVISLYIVKLILCRERINANV